MLKQIISRMGALALLMAAVVRGADSPLPVNVTPSSFSVAMSVPALASAELSVFADANGNTNLARVLGIENYPVNTGDPSAANSYDARKSKAALREASRLTQLAYARVLGCAPATTYYFRLRVTDTNGVQSFVPSSGPLPAVTTSLQNSLLPQAKQLIIQLPTNYAGRVMTLSHPSALYKIAAMVGDGVEPNEVFFNLSEMFAQAGNGNLELLGSQRFDAEMLGNVADVPPSPYTLNYTSGFVIGQINTDKSELLRLQIGSALLTIGQSGSTPIQFSAIRGVQSFSFLLDLPTNRLSNVAVSSGVGSALLETVSPSRYRLTLTAPAGQLLQGTQEVAQLTFNTVTPQSSAIIPTTPFSFLATRPDLTTMSDIASEGGEIVLVGSQPLLVADANPARILTLYGTPGASYEMQSSDSLQTPIGWGSWTNISLSALSRTFPARPTTNLNIFFRARQTSP